MANPEVAGMATDWATLKSMCGTDCPYLIGLVEGRLAYSAKPDSSTCILFLTDTIPLDSLIANDSASTET